MNQNKLFNLALGLLVGILFFAVNIGYLANFTGNALPTDTPKTSFTAIDAAETISQNQARGKGIFKIGEFAMLQLTDNTSELKLTQIEFEPAAKTIKEASGEVLSGSVLATNLLFGPKLQLTDKNVVVTNRGGSFILETQENGSRIEILSGSAKVIVNSPTGSKNFTAALTAQQEITLDTENLTKLFASEDELQRSYTWSQLVQKSKNRFDGENILISKLINQLPSPETETTLEKNLNTARKYFLFSPYAKKNFYWQQIQTAFSQVVTGEKTALASYFTQTPSEDQEILQEVVKAAAAYTQIFLPENLSPKIKEGVMRLTASFPQIAQFTAVEDLDAEATLMRSLAFTDTDPTNTEYSEIFGEKTLDKGITDSAELTGELIALLENNKKVVNEKWLANFAQINSLHTETKAGLAAAIMNQLKLAKVLINSNQGNLGSSALQGLANLLTQGKDQFEASLLEKISLEGNDLKNRIAFLAGNHGAASDTFDEAAYEKWLAEQNLEVTAENTPAEITEPEIVVVEESSLPASEIKTPEEITAETTSPAEVTPEKTTETPTTEVTPPTPAKKIPRG